MVADLPPDIDLQEHLEAGTALQGNYFYETTVNVDNRVKKVVEKFRDDLRVEMSDDGDMTILVVNADDLIKHASKLKTGESYQEQLLEQAYESNRARGESYFTAKMNAIEQLDGLSQIRHYSTKDSETHDYLPNALESKQLFANVIDKTGSSFAITPHNIHQSKYHTKNLVSEDPTKNVGAVTYKHSHDTEIFEKGCYEEMTLNTSSLHIEGYTLSSEVNSTLLHEVGHPLSQKYSDNILSINASEAMADILRIAYDAADGDIKQEDIDRLILLRSYNHMNGDHDHYTVPAIIDFLETTDLSSFEGLDKDEITKNVLDQSENFLRKRTYIEAEQKHPLTNEVLGRMNVPELDTHPFIHNGKRMLRQATHAKNNLFPDQHGDFISPKQLAEVMKHKGNDLKLSESEIESLQHIADRAYLVTTEEDITLGLDKLEYEKPNTLGSEEIEQPQIIQEVENTYPYDISAEVAEKATGEELAVATYHNSIVQDVWRDVETLEDHNITTDQRAHKLNQYIRATQQEGYTPPVGLSAENVEMIHQQHEDSIAYHVSLDISIQQMPEHEHFKEKEQDDLAL